MQRVSIADELVRLRTEWDGLAGAVPFRRWDWLEAWWRHFHRAEDELWVVCVRDTAGSLVGLAPCYLKRSLMGGAVIRFLGDEVTCSDYVTILSACGREEEVADSIAHWLCSESGRGWDALLLSGLRPEDRCTWQLIRRLRESGCTMRQSPGPVCFRLALPADWESYLKRLSAKRRWRARRMGRLYFETGRAVRRSVRSRTEIPTGLAILEELHQKRRRSLGGRGVFALPGFASFLREVADRFLVSGRLRLHWVELDGRPVAAHFDLLGGGTTYQYQSGMEPDRSSERPGWLGTMASLRWAIDGDQRSVDFLRGEERYKAHWRGEPYPSLDIHIAAPGILGALRGAAWAGLAHARHWAKRQLQR